MGKTKLKRALELDVIDFAEHTSAHGIPRAYVSLGFRRYLWLTFFFACFFAFGYQAYLIVVRFNRNDIIVGVEIKFEEIKFPAVTICNMNPYKNSASRDIGTIKNALEAFEMAIDKSDDHIHFKRKKRSIGISRVIGMEMMCKMDSHMLNAHPNGHIQCICSTFENNDDPFYWNCHPSVDWKHRIHNIDLITNSFTSDYCHDTMCLQYPTLMEMVWPLELSHDNSTDIICISPSESNQKYCKPKDQFEISTCSKCDWNGKCQLSIDNDNDNDMKCVCNNDNCFQVRSITPKHKRDKRMAEKRLHERLLSRYEGLLAVYSHCNCTKQHGCVSTPTSDPDDEYSNKTCLCFYNKKNEQVWPCYKEADWQERKCSRCNTFGDCVYTDKPKKQTINCLCALPIKMCVRVDPPYQNSTTLDDRLVKFWDIQPSTTQSPVVKKKEEREKAYGYTGVKDRIALRAKAMENIIFAVDALTEEQKWRISYNKSDFILKCSFNGKECNVKHDFVEYLDPTYGACFTYGQRLGNVTNERAGPAYGLRLEVFVNVTEYLPTTEAAGVRLTVHATDEQPFPDTLGFSAPTGFVSSFGIKLKSMVRLPAPYGDCVREGKNEDFIYTQKEYNTEGCQRSCIQKHLANTCGCGDPRFPPYRNTKNCPVDDPYKRECIKREMQSATKNSKNFGCSCKQPCNQDVYSVSYSASRWPAVAGDLSGCPMGMPAHHCLNYKREQGSMIEVYFEQLNYESLLESEAYALPNLLSDFGGQLGLWMGVSVITIMEFVIFIVDMIISATGIKRNKRRPARKSFSSSLRCSTDYNLNRDGDQPRIATFCTNSPDFLSLMIASQLVDITIIPLNPSYKKYEIHEYIEKSNANYVIISNDIDKEKFDEANVTVNRMTDMEQYDNDKVITIDKVEDTGKVIFFSSGTTGDPKPFEYNQSILCAQLEQIRMIKSDSNYYIPSPSDVCYGVLPYFHAGGLITVLSMLYSQCTVLVNERFDEKEFMDNCQKYKVSTLFVVPPVLNFLANHPIIDNYDLSHLKGIFVGAAPTPVEYFGRVKERIKTIENIIQLYGTTECGVLICSTQRGISDGSTVGIPYPMVEVTIDKEQQILIRSRMTIDKNGDYMETGDLGEWNEKGELVIIGRSKEMMKIRGWQVNPNEIEKVIRMDDRVIDCGVYQVIMEDNNSYLVAKVISRIQSDEVRDDIIQLVRDNLASYKQLKDVIFVSELPRNASGKLMRRLLI